MLVLLVHHRLGCLRSLLLLQCLSALLMFERFGLAPQPVYANRRDANPGLLPRWRNLANAERALQELIGIAQFHVYRWLGWF